MESMSRTTKNPIALARAALAAGKDALAPYSCPKSPHKFTQPQLFAMLVLKQFFKQDYRGTVEMVRQLPRLRKTLELKDVPNHNTLFYAEARLLKRGALAESLMQQFASPASAD